MARSRRPVTAQSSPPWIIDSWEIAGGDTEMTLTVKPDAKWREKPPYNTTRNVDAVDPAFNLLCIAGKLDPAGNPAPYRWRRTIPEGLDRAEAIDDSTVRVVFDRPDTLFLGGLSDHRNYTVPRDFEDNGGDFQDPTTFVGTARFSSGPSSNRTTMERHPNYWKEGCPTSTTSTSSGWSTRRLRAPLWRPAS